MMRKGIVANLSLILLSVFVALQTGISFGYPQPPNEPLPSGYPPLPNGPYPNGPYPNGGYPNGGYQPLNPQETKAQDMAQVNANLGSLWTGKRMECDDGWYTTPPFNCNACNDESCAEAHGFYKTWGLVRAKDCYRAGSDCAWSIDLGFTTICLRTAYYYCCYDSRFSKDLVEEAHSQLGYSSGYGIGQLGQLGFGGYYGSNGCFQLSVNELKRLDIKKLNPRVRGWLEREMGRIGLNGETFLDETGKAINHMYGHYRNDNGVKMIEKIDKEKNEPSEVNEILEFLKQQGQ